MVVRSLVDIYGTILLLLIVVGANMATKEQARIQQLEADRDALVQRLFALERRFAQQVPVQQVTVAPQADRTSVIDTRLMQKPQAFGGDRTAWSDWSFTFRAYVGAVNGRIQLLMDQAQASDTALPPAHDATDRALDEQLYFVIVMLVRTQR